MPAYPVTWSRQQQFDFVLFTIATVCTAALVHNRFQIAEIQCCVFERFVFEAFVKYTTTTSGDFKVDTSTIKA